MVINNEIDLDTAINISDVENTILIRRKNNMLLSNYQIKVLSEYGFDYTKYSNIKDLLFDIEEYLNNDFNDDLDQISIQLAEFCYYNETKK